MSVFHSYMYLSYYSMNVEHFKAFTSQELSHLHVRMVAQEGWKVAGR